MASSDLLSLRFWARPRLPVLLQTEAAECGLACMAMISRYWGHDLDLASMRRRFSISIKGATLKTLMTMAESLSLRTRPLKLGLEELASLRLPAVLHWNMNHFVVLKSVGSNHIVIHDPAVGERRVAMTAVSRHFTGVALEVNVGRKFARIEDRHKTSIRALVGHVVGLKRSLWQLLALGVALQVCALAAPFYMQWIVDDALLASDRNLVTVLGLGFALLVLIQTAIGGLRSWVTTVMATDLNFQWLGNAFTHLMKLPLPYFEKRHLGDIVSRFGSIQTIQHSVTTQLVEAVIDGFLVLATLGLMLFYNPLLSAIAVAAAALYVLLRWSIFRALRDATTEQIIHAAKQQTHFLESARGIQTVRIFGRADERRAGWMNHLADQFNSELRIARMSISYQTGNSLLFGLERVLVIWLAALAVMDARFSAGMLFAFISYKDQFSQRFAALVDKMFDLRMLRLHADRVADIVMTEPEAEPLHVELDLHAVEASVELKNVSFRYSDSEPWVLQGIDVKIDAGQCVAITGSSGCGKTTLVKLLLGLLEPTEGDILIGGQALRHIGLRNYRDMIGCVMQDDQLFAGSIADNVSFFDPAPVQESIEQSARLAAIHSEIAAMPMGYNTLVGDVGSGLSGGQKQRLLLARALYRSPKILLLDEATSHLDIWNEQAVNLAVRQIALTRILVAHRPETIAMAERVLLLERGRIARDFSHSAPARETDAHLRANPSAGEVADTMA